jgi:DNA polymerase-3 subunit gamma/tau
MSEYIVTARKWRPMKFDDVVGQNHVTTTVRNAIRDGRIAHAYLFSGPRGVGKTTTARLLAKAVNCLSPKDFNPDNACDSCIEITEGRSFDVFEIDGASNRGVDEIRNLRESVRYAPSKGKYKVYIIDEVHMLTKEAFNALLKTLEEPPPSVIFIFATTEIHKVPATILSRCQRFDFRRISTDEISANLKEIAAQEGITIEENALHLIAKRGDGSLRDAQSLFDQIVSLCGREITYQGILTALNIAGLDLFFNVTDLMKKKDTKGGVLLVDELMRQGHDLKDFLAGLTEHLRNILIAKTTGSTTLIEASDVYRQRYEKEAGHFPVPDLLRALRIVGATEAALGTSVQPRFKLEADLVLLIGMQTAQEVGSVLEQLDALKKKLHEVPQNIPPPARQTSMGTVSAGTLRRTTLHPTINVPPVHTGITGTTVEARKPAGAPVLSEGEVTARWPEFVSSVAKRRVSLGPVLELARPLAVQGNVIRISCQSAFDADSIRRNREFLAGLVREVFSVNAILETEITPPRVSASPKQSSGTEGGEKHPVIEAMIRELGAEPL